jgi:hypothetical protein
VVLQKYFHGNTGLLTEKGFLASRRAWIELSTEGNHEKRKEARLK